MSAGPDDTPLRAQHALPVQPRLDLPRDPLGMEADMIVLPALLADDLVFALCACLLVLILAVRRHHRRRQEQHLPGMAARGAMMPGRAIETDRFMTDRVDRRIDHVEHGRHGAKAEGPAAARQ